MPPAGTTFCVHPVCTPDEFRTALQQPTWIVPGVLGDRCPWRSLIASSCTCSSCDGSATAAVGKASAAMHPSAAASLLFICSPSGNRRHAEVDTASGCEPAVATVVEASGAVERVPGDAAVLASDAGPGAANRC